MCGIVGIASTELQSQRNWLAKASKSLTHRGPDDNGEWWSNDGRVGFAHRRLSILDLSPLGHQPMHRRGDGLTIVFNGEIYNFLELRVELQSYGFVFESHSDTEVLLVAYAYWGLECLGKIDGMFAFAIYDAPQKRLFIARDRSGEKPIFYYLNRGSFYFASELKALLSHPDIPRSISPDALDCYLLMGFVPGEHCILQGYKKLPPAHAMLFNVENGSNQIWRYWSLPEYQIGGASIDENGLLDDLERILDLAVRRQMIADVPVGVLLSGGIDSSLITAMAARHSDRVKTFSIRFPGHGNHDETRHARLIADYFGTEHIELTADPDCADLLPILARQYDEPIVDSSMFPTWIVSKLVSQHCKVALGGDGGDELFGGYRHYSRLLWMQQKTRFMPAWMRYVLAAGSAHLPVGFKGRNYLQGLRDDFQKSVPLIANYFDVGVRSRLMRDYNGGAHNAESIYSSRVADDSDLLQRLTRFDFENYLPEDILVKVDRASMLNSLEIRAPFLDRSLVEFAFSKVPSQMKSTSSERKILLKRLALRVLPPEFDRQRKQGFSIPLGEWLKSGRFRDLFWDTLLNSACVFDADTVRELLEGQDRGLNNGERLFALVQFELWRKAYDITL